MGIQEPEPGQAVTSTTEEITHPADAGSGPGPYTDLSPERPPVSTTQPDVPIAHSLVAGAGEGNQNQEIVEIEPQAQTKKTAKDE